MRAASFNDFSANFSELKREIWATDGNAYRDFLKSLVPDYSRVRRDIARGYVLLAVTMVAATLLPRIGIPPLIAAILGAISVGYWIAYLQLFMHEAAHYNLASDRKSSDRIGGRYLSWIAGTSVAAYRDIHFQHHRALGTIDDSENSYFFPLNLIFLAKALFGVRAAEILWAQKVKSRPAADPQPAKATSRSPQISGAMIAAPLVHGGIALAAFLLGYWWTALAWIAGVGLFFPFFGAVRQILEHRDENAASGTDFRRVPHGAVTRLFGDGPLSSTFGAAGFNRHLLHHWEPQVSYTNLGQLEEFLLTTKAGPLIEKRRTTYNDAFLKLLSLR